MPRSAPTVNGTPTYVLLSMRYVDANGVKDSFALRTTLARATDTLVEAYIVALAAATNVNIYAVEKQLIYASPTASPLLALEAPRIDARDVIEQLQKDIAAGASQYSYIPAPLDEIFVPDTNTVDLANALYDAVTQAVDLILPASYNPISVRFAQHKLLAPKTNL